MFESEVFLEEALELVLAVVQVETLLQVFEFSFPRKKLQEAVQSSGLVFGKGKHEVQFEDLNHKHSCLIPAHLVNVEAEQAVEFDVLAFHDFGAEVAGLPLPHEKLTQLGALFGDEIVFEVGEFLPENNLVFPQARVPEVGDVHETAQEFFRGASYLSAIEKSKVDEPIVL